MKTPPPAVLALVLLLGLFGNRAEAHFQVLLPSSDVVAAGDDQTVVLDLHFTHPMEQGPVMEMALPRQFGVLVGGKKQNLAKQLRPRKLDGKPAYTAAVKTGEPGDYVFFVEPAPYWEAAERKWIIHYTKVVVDVLGAEEGWDAAVGLPVEIEPLVRPYGLWTGNTFRGIVRRDGKPVPFAQVEVEYFNAGKRVKVPNGAFVTQVIKADANGTFCYTMPRAGWWGFAALVEGEKRPGPDGKPAQVELGGLMWVKAVDMQAGDAKEKR
jgi:cobalt/nickel transport protein